MPVSIKGKEYNTVAERVRVFHEEHKDVETSVITETLDFEGDGVARVHCIIKIGAHKEYHGEAFERAGSTFINETSHLENAETSALGRALAAAGYAGSEYASADEVQNAINQRQTPTDTPEPAKTPRGGPPPASSTVPPRPDKEVAPSDHSQEAADARYRKETYGDSAPRVTKGSAGVPASDKQKSYLEKLSSFDHLTDDDREGIMAMLADPNLDKTTASKAIDQFAPKR